MALPSAKYRKLINEAAYMYALPVARNFAPAIWLEGLVMQESSGNPRARRYEAHHDRAGRRDSSMDPDIPGIDDSMFEDDASYGLCQVMGWNAKRIYMLEGRLDYTFLFSPVISLDLCCRILREELKIAGMIPRALARYNGGPTGDALVGPEGKMRLDSYVNGVFAWAAKVRQDVIGTFSSGPQ
jgi:hypothetical protein